MYLSKILTEAFQVRSDSYYDDYYMISKEEVMQYFSLIVKGIWYL